jgi:hypothetical protein
MLTVREREKSSSRFFIHESSVLMSTLLEGTELEEALLAYCKNATAAPDPAVTAASFERGIGGTKADHIAEKVTVQKLRCGPDAAALARC